MGLGINFIEDIKCILAALKNAASRGRRGQFREGYLAALADVAEALGVNEFISLHIPVQFPMLEKPRGEVIILKEESDTVTVIPTIIEGKP